MAKLKNSGAVRQGLVRSGEVSYGAARQGLIKNNR